MQSTIFDLFISKLSICFLEGNFMRFYTGKDQLKYMACMKYFINRKSNDQITRCLTVLHCECIFGNIVALVLFTLRCRHH